MSLRGAAERKRSPPGPQAPAPPREAARVHTHTRTHRDAAPPPPPLTTTSPVPPRARTGGICRAHGWGAWGGGRAPVPHPSSRCRAGEAFPEYVAETTRNSGSWPEGLMQMVVSLLRMDPAAR